MSKGLWEMNEDEIFELSKRTGQTFRYISKRGIVKTGVTCKKRGMNGDYITFSGSEYMSIHAEVINNQIDRAKKHIA